MRLLFMLPMLGISVTASAAPSWQDRPPIREQCSAIGQPELKISKGTASNAMARGMEVERFLNDCYGEAMELVSPIEYLVEKEKAPIRYKSKFRSNAESANRLSVFVEPRNGYFTILVIHHTPDEPMCYMAARIISDRYIDMQTAKCWYALQRSASSAIHQN